MPIYKGKNVDEAIENGLYELNLKKNEVKINIIEEGNAGVFGFFEKEAEVEITPLSPLELKVKKLIPYLIGVAVIFIILLLVLFGGNSDKSTSVPTSTSTEASSIVEKSVEKTNEASSTSQSSTSISSSSTSTSSSSTESSSTSPAQSAVITTENNEEFKALLQTDDSSAITNFIQKYKGQVIEFDGHIADIAHYKNYKTKFDMLIYGGNYLGAEQAPSGPNFKFVNITTVSNAAFNSFNGENISKGQNVHIKAQIGNYNSTQDLVYLSPIEVSPR
ncbi:DNA/RNA-binding protein [Streptococcus pneumoniae]|nr:DNA/RNA-binding protein [Streptococcus pneumoniae]